MLPRVWMTSYEWHAAKKKKKKDANLSVPVTNTVDETKPLRHTTV